MSEEGDRRKVEVVTCVDLFSRSKSPLTILEVSWDFFWAKLRMLFNIEHYYFVSMNYRTYNVVVNIAVATMGVDSPIPIFQHEAQRAFGGEPWDFQVIFYQRISKLSYDHFAASNIEFRKEAKRIQDLEDLKPKAQDG